MALTKNAIYYFLKAKRISISKVARDSGITRQTMQAAMKRSIWNIQLNTYYRISEATDMTIGEVIDEIVRIDKLMKENEELDDEHFSDYLRWGIYD